MWREESGSPNFYKMSQLMRKQVWYLQLLMMTPSAAQRKAMLDTITNDQLRALTEVAHNLLQGRIPISESHKRKLRTHKTFLQVLGDIKVPLAKKREALCRKGAVVILLLRASAGALKHFIQ